MKIFIELTRDDLRRGFENLPIKEVSVEHTDLSDFDRERAHKIVFIENSGYRKILKKR